MCRSAAVYSDRVQRLILTEPDGAWAAVGRALVGGSPLAVAPAGNQAALDALQPAVPVTEPDAAIVALTSGSTGVPKAVVLSRPALRAASELLHARLGGPGTWTCALPVGYIAGLMTLVRTWYADAEPRFARSDLSDVDPGTGRSYLSVVATQLHRALEVPDCVARLRDFAAVVVGGSAIPQDLVRRARELGICVVTSYGMSETCGGCVYDGVPLDGVGIGTNDDGRVWISGPTLFSGYRLRPDLTAAALSAGRFLTADRATVDRDGRVRVIGRVDDVVISGGVNVDLADLQRTIDDASEVPVVVLALPDTEWGVRIVAVTTGDIGLHDIHAMLPVDSPARPRDLRRVSEFPVTATGKLDRQALIREWD